MPASKGQLYSYITALGFPVPYRELLPDEEQRNGYKKRLQQVLARGQHIWKRWKQERIGRIWVRRYIRGVKLGTVSSGSGTLPVFKFRVRGYEFWIFREHFVARPWMVAFTSYNQHNIHQEDLPITPYGVMRTVLRLRWNRAYGEEPNYKFRHEWSKHHDG